MTEQIRIGIIGTSGYAKLLLNTLTEYDDAKFAAICGRTRSRAAELAAEYQIDQVFTDYHDMIKHGRLDGIIVASPFLGQMKQPYCLSNLRTAPKA